KTAVVTFSEQTAPAAANRNGIAAGDFAAAIAWWREAGVDHAFSDESHGWLAEPEPTAANAPPQPQFVPPPPPAPEPAVRIGGAADALPTDLVAFAAWWQHEPSLDGGQIAGRVAPRGTAGAEVMVLVDHPEADDGDRLLSGPQGRMLDAILTALGIAPDQAYVASVLPRHTPMPDWAALHAAGLGDVTAQHVRLARPRRLLLFGAHISSLLGHDPTKTAEPLREFNQDGTNVPVLVAPGLAALLVRPRGKARLWQELLDWSA
ncbi:MAG: hypothetical protein RLZZ427_153, partial [Pseudomonadota bacterium]